MKAPVEHDAALQISLFGRFELAFEGASVTINSPAMRMLVAYLLLHRRASLPRIQISTAFWPDASESRGLTNLRTLLYRLRQTAPFLSPYLRVSKQYLQWEIDGSFGLDVERFEEAMAEAQRSPSAEAKYALYQRAIASYKGALLPECYDDWIDPIRAHMSRVFVQGLEELVTLSKALGQSSALRHYFQMLYRESALQEEWVRAMMRFYWEEGEAPTAEELYLEHAFTLAHELQLEPEPKTRLLYEQILQSPAPKRPGRPAVALEVAAEGPTLDADPFVGRQRELRELEAMLSEPACRWVTLVGMGGVGKTRLAKEAMVRCAPQGGYAWVSLANTKAQESLALRIATQLRVPLSQESSPEQALFEHLRGQHLLLVLDEFERCAPMAPWLMELLAEAPGLKLLLTSRRSLHGKGEWLMEIEGLSVPAEATREAIEGSDAAALFGQRVRQRTQAEAFAEPELPHIFGILRQLDGMPLGIELASAWSRTLTFQEIHEELLRDPGALDDLYESLPPKHRSLRILFEKSCELLPPESREALCALSLFSGGFRRGAAREIAGLSLSQLHRLVEHSLLKRDGRFRMHEIIRTFAEDQLRKMPQLHGQLLERFGTYYYELLQRRHGLQTGADLIQLYDELTEELPNIHKAFHLLLESQRYEDSCAMLQTLVEYYRNTRRYYEGFEWIQQLEAWTPRGSTEAADFLHRLLAWRGIFLQMVGKIAECLAPLQQSLDYFQSHDDARMVALCTNGLGFSYIMSDRLDEAQAMLLGNLERCQNHSLNLDRAACLYCLGTLEIYRQGFSEARAFLQDSLELYEALQEPFQVANLYNGLGAVFTGLQEYELAEQHYLKGIELMGELDDQWGLAGCLCNYSQILHGLGKKACAREAMEQALSLSIGLRRRRLRVHILVTQGFRALEEERLEEAEAAFLEGLARADENDYLPLARAAIAGLASLAFIRGRHLLSMQLLMQIRHLPLIDLNAAEVVQQLTPQLDALLTDAQRQGLSEQIPSFEGCVQRLLQGD